MRHDDDMDEVERKFIAAMRLVAVACVLMALAVAVLVAHVVLG